MTRKRIKHEQIINEERRNVTFKKRMDGLLKKANELSILCGISVAIIIHKKWENNAVLWPSPSVLGERLQKFMDYRSEERERRIVTHESFMEQLVQGEREEIIKLKKAIQMKESQELMVKSMQTNSFNGLRLDQLNAMNSFADDMLKKLLKKDMELNSQH
ncbi:hypothetical protein C2S52_022062 [Perilla frutescens var. hirtella]|uniref:MADS-box domain-containing protein n=1 Tax=Perilla frutescens var. hirtella TaxID=608512 RepID=A0AAD4IQ43_PERFH|nr:hypothetical protein C2S53_001094 [Perilla frutescens var. hirtella]KAH6797508.1 hypothetical protein C2S52_022062 [Perilla frutescens var. hirtella]KAH6807528.1 hypothetical protein C2S51_028636 [Perilla frutescens var. frutescens]